MTNYNILNLPVQDAIPLLPSIDCVITSPPYFQLRWRETDSPLEIGAESTLDEYIDKLAEVFGEIGQKLAEHGNMFINLGDRITLKRQLFIPQRLAIAMEKHGLIPHQEIIWKKTNAQPSSKHDRMTTVTESVLWVIKHPKNFYHNLDPLRVPHKSLPSAVGDNRVVSRPEKTKCSMTERRDEIGSPRARANRDKKVNYYHPMGRNPGNVWEIPTEKNKLDHFSAMPKELVRRCAILGCPQGGIILDPFSGSGTTAEVAITLGMNTIAVEISEKYCDFIRERLNRINREV